MSLRPEDRFPLALLLVFTFVWVALAVAPLYRQDWLLENLLVFVAVPWLVSGHRRNRFSNAAYSCFFVFLLLHLLGAHYTYSEVPYDQWFSRLTGSSLNELFGARRNHYDRAIHFLYGLLISVPAYELINRRAAPRGLWAFLLPWTFMLSHSAIYETLEWLAAMLFGGPLGTAYLGTQGDEWDAQKDVALAALGATLMLALILWRSVAKNAPSRSGQRPPGI